jgi:hypothetical protein
MDVFCVATARETRGILAAQHEREDASAFESAAKEPLTMESDPI